MGGAKCDPRPLYQEQEWSLQKCQYQGQGQWGLWAAPPLLALLDCGLKSDQSSASRSNRFGGSRYSHSGRWHHRESRGHMKINLPVFKDEDTKDTITYQSWCWDLIVYYHVGCWDRTFLPYAICSLQGYPGELVRSLGTEISLDNILTIVDEHYNNVKALVVLNQELFQLWMAEKEIVLDWGCICWDTSRFMWHHSQNTFLLTM